VYKENAEALVVARKEFGLDVNVENTKYLIMSRDQNSGRGYSMKIDNIISSSETVEEFKYLETTLRNQNFIQEEIMNRLKVGNAYYQSGKNLSVLTENLKIKFI
jgi:hypothetical protein